MALVSFYKGLESSYSADTYQNSIYQCTDTDNVYIFGVLHKSVSQATDTTLGTIKIGYNQNQGNYPVALDGDGKAYVPVDLTYEEASGTSGELDIASMVILTQQQYDDLETKNQNTIYFIRG